MNREQEYIIHMMKRVNESRIFTYMTIAILFFGIGMLYKAGQDVDYFNNLLEDMSIHNESHNGYITNGDKIYSVYKSETNFSKLDLLNRTQCLTLYGIGDR